MKSLHLVPLRDDLIFPIEATFEKFFQDFFNSKANIDIAKSNTGYPKVNCFFEGDKYKIVYAVPGLKQDDLRLDYDEKNGTITVAGRMSAEHIPSADQYVLRELRQSQFSRTLSLQPFVSGEPESAVLADGLLTLTWSIAKPELPKVKQIAIQSQK